jgi:hypothetical protein
MSERNWEVVPGCRGLIRKRTLSVRFCSYGGDAKNSSIRWGAETARRSVDGNKFREVFRTSTTDSRVNQGRNFVLYSM